MPSECGLFSETSTESIRFGLCQLGIIWMSFLYEQKPNKGRTSMIRFDLRPESLRCYRVGPLGPYAESFAALVSQQGYCLHTVQQKVSRMAALSRWLEEKHIKPKQLKEQHIQAFLRARWKRFSSRDGDQLTMRTLLQHLRQFHAIPAPGPGRPTEIASLEQEYARFLTEERALAQLTVTSLLRVARRFISHCFQGGKIQWKNLRAGDVTDCVLKDTSHRGRRDVQKATTGLRSFLRFLFQQGRITTNLAMAVPTVAGWPLSQLPRFLGAKQVERLLRSCDRRTKVGKRDYAILVLLARLGLRAGEVANLGLEDIDWRAGELLIRGKGERLDKLPLLQDVGQALVAYLHKARPDCSSRRVFVQCFAPYTGLSHTTVGSVVRRALNRAQIQSRYRGAHVLRHSLATLMLSRGASLAQIGQVLRHQSVGSTQIYAKVDLNALRRLALPWLGGAL
jgi:integrase/recombinase XerD